MCGIVGFVNLDGEPADQQLLRSLGQPLRHRGPDGEGFEALGPVGLGHLRLSIIDLSTGAQPMSAAAGTLWVTFNGEIYNYVELREELTARGRSFVTRSDTEVILQA
jgi:asparagine synthase (glutamine-hydrolysing)